jgi:predicted  nucleic acid-binding Zn-ribbon protein
LKGTALENAIQRHKARRVTMNKDLLKLRGRIFENEKFIEDYQEEGIEDYAF